MRVLFAMLFLASFTNAFAQHNKYWLELKDKSGSPFRIDRPQEFLAEQAIKRRLNQGIPVNIQDLPVSRDYCNAVRNEGAKILYTSKWFNALAIACDESLKNKLERLPFVKSIQLIGLTQDKNTKRTKSGTQEFEMLNAKFGFESRQLKVLNGDYLHQLGFRGQGKMIAVIDGGFIGLHKSDFFDSLRMNGLLLPSKDFVDGDEKVNHSSGHGTKVLSVMAANQPGLLVGMAPQASYVCIRTEDRREEMRIEECNWIAGLEYADSLGVDIVNSSLGYAKFNLSSMDYDYEDLDGKTSLVSQAAEIAFSKGILVVTSAGNNGDFNDHFVDAPGDAENILTVGSTNFNGLLSSFSSYGETVDGRMKPEVLAPGEKISVGSLFGLKVHTASGTSYASPLIAGLAGALWSAFPEKSNRAIRRAIIQSTKYSDGSGDVTRAGLPDFKKAFFILKEN